MNAAAGAAPVILLLAAGEGRRFGGIKQLAELDGEPMCRHVAKRLLALGRPLVVVTGAHAPAVEQALDGLSVEIVRHGGWSEGLGSSIGRGARHLRRHHGSASGVLVCLADQPLVDPAHYQRLLDRHGQAPSRLLATRHGEVSGPPVLFPADCLADLAACSGRRGAHALLQRESARVEHVRVDEHPDVDTHEDLAQVRTRMKLRTPPG